MTTQQQLLKDAQAQMGKSARTLAKRLGNSFEMIKTWMLPDDDQDHQDMPRSAKTKLESILAAHALKKSKLPFAESDD